MLIWFDTETSGLDPKVSQILELGYIETDLQLNPLSWGNHFLKPDFKKFPANKKSLEINGYSEEVWTRLGEEREKFFRQFAKKAKGKNLCGQNVQFDRSFLEEEYRRANIKNSHKRTYIETYTAFFMDNLKRGEKDPFDRVALSKFASDKGMTQKEPHNAFSDTILTLNLFRIVNGMEPLTEKDHPDLFKYEERVLSARGEGSASVFEQPEVEEDESPNYLIFIGGVKEGDPLPDKNVTSYYIESNYKGTTKPWDILKYEVSKVFSKDIIGMNALVYNSKTKKGFYLKIDSCKYESFRVKGCSKAYNYDK
jgi:DNA polymerase III epsilon subunit-like protein